MIVFLEECSLLVDRLRPTSECCIELRPCYKSTTLLFSLLSQSIQLFIQEQITGLCGQGMRHTFHFDN